MAHPNLRSFDAVPDRVVTRDSETGEAIFAPIPFFNTPAKVIRNQLVSVTDAEDWNALAQHTGVDGRASGFVNASWATRDDDPLPGPKRICRGVARLDVRVDTQFTHTSSYEVRILPTGVENRNLRNCNGGNG